MVYVADFPPLEVRRKKLIEGKVFVFILGIKAEMNCIQHFHVVYGQSIAFYVF